MLDSFSRTRLLLGKEAMENLKNSNVLIFGLGGAGSSAAEALARSGIGEFTLIDGGVIEEKNIRHQLLSDRDLIGKSKVSVIKSRIEEINSKAVVHIVEGYYFSESDIEINFSNFDLVLDTINGLEVKKSIIIKANNTNIPVISCIDLKNRYNPALLEVSDLLKISDGEEAVCLKSEIIKHKIKKLTVVYSKEMPSEKGDLSFVPSAAGLALAGEAVRILSKKKIIQIEP